MNISTVNAKEYLKSIRTLDRRIKIKEEELYSLQLNLAQISSQALNERVLSSSTNDTMKAVDEIVDMQAEIRREICNFVHLKNEARNKINQLSDSRYVDILTDYYINCKTWEQVAEDNGYSDRHVRRLHGYALQSFRRKFDMI
ncbi:MAG: hypothetical protein J1E85_09310 [Ruminococcus sp.]|nr:hypothetical protein [Ruminococcus sp.]